MPNDRSEKSPETGERFIPDPSRLRGWAPHLSESQFQACELYVRELLRFNSKLNLISSGTAKVVDAVHVLDSIKAWSLIQARIPSGAEIYDFGTGNGLPGLLSAALSPDRGFRLVDRDERKLEFCKHVAFELKLKNVAFMRVDVASLPDSSVRYAMSRGFANVTNSLLMIRQQLEVGGKFFMLKGESWSMELANVPPAIFSVWKNEMIGQYKLPDTPSEFVVLQSTKLVE